MPTAEIDGSIGALNRLVVTPDGRYAAASNQQKTATFDLQAGKLLRVVGGMGEQIAVSANDDRHILSGSRDGTLTLWDVRTGAAVRRMQHPGTPEHVTVTADGSGLFEGRRHSAFQGQRRFRITPAQFRAFAARLAPRARRAATSPMTAAQVAREPDRPPPITPALS